MLMWLESQRALHAILMESLSAWACEAIKKFDFLKKKPGSKLKSAGYDWSVVLDQSYLERPINHGFGLPTQRSGDIRPGETFLWPYR